MIIDKLQRAEKYYFMNPYFQQAFDFVINNNLNEMLPGKYEIDGDNSFLIIADDKPNPEFKQKLEAHQTYIDVQMVIDGSLKLTWKSIEECTEIINEYNPEIDAAFFVDNSDFEVVINPGTFVILFPEDAHYPQTPNIEIKKAILKIKNVN